LEPSELLNTLRIIRQEQKLIREDIASCLGVRSDSLKVYESGGQFPSLNLLFRWVDLLGYEIDLHKKG